MMKEKGRPYQAEFAVLAGLEKKARQLLVPMARVFGTSTEGTLFYLIFVSWEDQERAARLLMQNGIRLFNWQHRIIRKGATC